jgi:hypothetical protein
MVMSCALEGCENQFEVKVYPRQYVYPKYCPVHRNEYKRVRHLQQIGREDLVEQMLKESESIEIDITGKEKEEEAPEAIEDVA